MPGGVIDETELTPAERQNLVRSALDSAMRVHGPMVEKYIARARHRRPDATPAEVIRALERMYRSALTGTGAAVGAVAAVPAVGTGTALALSGGEVLSTLELTALFAFSLAQIHGVTLDEIERRRTLVMGIMIGGSGGDIIPKIAERTGQHWAKEILAKVTRSELVQINKVLGENFITKVGTKEGIIVLGRVIPFGIGAAIGGGANLVLAETAIRASRRAFGPPPESWDQGKLPTCHGAAVLDVDGLPAKRHLDIAVPLKKRTAIINDNEGDQAKMEDPHDAYQARRS